MENLKFGQMVKLGMGLYVGWSIAEIMDRMLGKIYKDSKREKTHSTDTIFKAKTTKPEEPKKETVMGFRPSNI